MLEGLFLLGLGIFIIGGVYFLITAFGTSVMWGLGCLFVTPVTILYLIFHWEDAKQPFLIQIIGFVIIFVVRYAQGTLQF